MDINKCKRTCKVDKEFVFMIGLCNDFLQIVYKLAGFRKETLADVFNIDCYKNRLIYTLL